MFEASTNTCLQSWENLMRQILDDAFENLPETLLLISMTTTYCFGGALILTLWKKHHVGTYNIFIMLSLLAKLPIIFTMVGKVSFISMALIAILVIHFMSLTYRTLRVYFKNEEIRSMMKSYRRTFLALGIAFKFVYLMMLYSFIQMCFCATCKILRGQSGTLCKIRECLPCLITEHIYLYMVVLVCKIIRNFFCLLVPKARAEAKNEETRKKYMVDTCGICNELVEGEGDLRFTLKCGHIYHEECITVSAIVCENNFCYICKTPIESKLLRQKRCMKWAMCISHILQIAKVNLILATTFPVVALPILFMRRMFRK